MQGGEEASDDMLLEKLYTEILSVIHCVCQQLTRYASHQALINPKTIAKNPVGTFS